MRRHPRRESEVARHRHGLGHLVQPADRVVAVLAGREGRDAVRPRDAREDVCVKVEDAAVRVLRRRELRELLRVERREELVVDGVGDDALVHRAREAAHAALHH